MSRQANDNVVLNQLTTIEELARRNDKHSQEHVEMQRELTAELVELRNKFIAQQAMHSEIEKRMNDALQAIETNKKESEQSLLCLAAEKQRSEQMQVIIAQLRIQLASSESERTLLTGEKEKNERLTTVVDELRAKQSASDKELESLRKVTSEQKKALDVSRARETQLMLRQSQFIHKATEDEEKITQLTLQVQQLTAKLELDRHEVRHNTEKMKKEFDDSQRELGKKIAEQRKELTIAASRERDLMMKQAQYASKLAAENKKNTELTLKLDELIRKIPDIAVRQQHQQQLSQLIATQFMQTTVRAGIMSPPPNDANSHRNGSNESDAASAAASASGR